MKSIEEKTKDAELSFRKEQLSVAFFNAVMAKVGGDIQETKHRIDTKGIDAYCYVDEILIGTHTFCSTSFLVQLKATSHPRERKTFYSLPLSPKHYRAYRKLACDGTLPFFLCLFILPADINEDEWLVLGDEELLMRGRMYWAEFDCFSNKKTVRFLKTNRVDEDGIKQMIMGCNKFRLGSLG